MTKPTDRLRFAALTRVSTERQEQQGESLRTQRSRIETAVRKLRGTIVKWYSGQEHATEGHEREQFNAMLRDAEQQRFDAMIVDEASRLTRDPATNVQLVGVFKTHGIRLFTLEREHDLHDAQDRFFLDILAGVHGYAVAANIAKSRQNRIALARQGFPSCGTLPYGRLHDAERNRWSIDLGAQQLLGKAAKRLLNGEAVERIAPSLELHANTLRRRLLQAGSEWTQRFKDKGQTVEVPTRIPGLLPDEIVERIRKQLRRNRIVTKRPYTYALAHVVRCAACGSVLSGAGTKAARYYRHHLKRVKCEQCVNHIPAERLETAVLGQLGQLLHEPRKLQALIEKSLKHQQDGDGEDLDVAIASLEKRTAKLEREINNLMDELASEGSAVRKRVRAAVEERERKLASVKAELAQKHALKDRPELPRDLGKRVAEVVRQLVGINGYKIFAWPTEAQQRLVLYFVGGPVNGDATRGIWVKRDRKLEREYDGRVWTYRLDGNLAVGSGALTLTGRGKPAVVPALEDAVTDATLRRELDGDALVDVASSIPGNRSVKPSSILARS